LTWQAGLVSAVVAALPLAVAVFVVRRGRSLLAAVSRGIVVGVVLGGVAAGAGTFFLVRAALGALELSVTSDAVTRTSALLTLLFFVAPIEEAAKVAVVWPVARRGMLASRALGMILSSLAALGFASAESALLVALGGPVSWLAVLRVAAAMPAHGFCAALWGYAWAGRQQRGRYLPVLWVTSVVVHALYDHIVFARGPGLLVVTVPLLGAMGVLTWSALRDVAPAESRSLFPRAIPEPPSLEALRLALRRADQPLKFRWISVGALVNVGMVMVSIAGAVFLARRLGIDLSLADEADVRGASALLLLGAAVLLAFPLSGYLVARASGVRGVLEPAFAAGVAIALSVGFLSLTAPLAVIVALAVAPVAFGLACAGAWFGLEP
jgi:hypothetical protein